MATRLGPAQSDQFVTATGSRAVLAVALIESSFHISRNIMFHDASNLLPGDMNVKFHGTACNIMLDEPLLSAQAPR